MTVLKGLGMVERIAGDYELSREYHERSLSIAQVVGDRRHEAEVLRDLGAPTSSLFEDQHAREYHERSIAIQEELDGELVSWLDHVTDDERNVAVRSTLGLRVPEGEDEHLPPFVECWNCGEDVEREERFWSESWDEPEPY